MPQTKQQLEALSSTFTYIPNGEWDRRNMSRNSYFIQKALFVKKIPQAERANMPVLVCGAGNGHEIETFKEEGFTNITGIDARPHENYPNTIIQAHMGTPETSLQDQLRLANKLEQYAIVTSHYMMDHNYYPNNDHEAMIRQMIQVVKPGGLLYIFEPLTAKTTEAIQNIILEQCDALVLTNPGILGIFKKKELKK